MAPGLRPHCFICGGISCVRVESPRLGEHFREEYEIDLRLKPGMYDKAGVELARRMGFRADPKSY